MYTNISKRCTTTVDTTWFRRRRGALYESRIITILIVQSLQRNSVHHLRDTVPPQFSADVGQRVTFPVASCCRIANIISLRAWQAPKLGSTTAPSSPLLLTPPYLTASVYPARDPTTFSTRSNRSGHRSTQSDPPLVLLITQRSGVTTEAVNRVHVSPNIVPSSDRESHVDFSNCSPRIVYGTIWNVYTQLLVASTFTRITRARWMILVREKCRTNSPCESNKRHLQNRARFNRACSEDLRLERKSRYPERCVSLFSALSLSLFLFTMDHRREFCNGIKFCQKYFTKRNKVCGYSLRAINKKG